MTSIAFVAFKKLLDKYENAITGAAFAEGGSETHVAEFALVEARDKIEKAFKAALGIKEE